MRRVFAPQKGECAAHGNAKRVEAGDCRTPYRVTFADNCPQKRALQKGANGRREPFAAKIPYDTPGGVYREGGTNQNGKPENQDQAEGV